MDILTFADKHYVLFGMIVVASSWVLDTAFKSLGGAYQMPHECDDSEEGE